MKNDRLQKCLYGLLTIVLMLPSLSVSLQAQSAYTAQLRGTVKDASGAVSDAGPTQRNGALQPSNCTIRHETRANEDDAGTPQGIMI